MPTDRADAAITWYPVFPESLSSEITAAVLPLAPVATPWFFNCWSISAPQVEPDQLTGVGGTMQPVNPKAYGFLQKPVEMPQPKKGTCCCARNCDDCRT